MASRAVLRGWRHPQCWPPKYCPQSPTALLLPQTPLLTIPRLPHQPRGEPSPPSPPPPPRLLTNNRSLKTRNFILMFTIFSKLFEKFCHFLSFFSPRCRGTSSKVFIIGYCILSSGNGMVSTLKHHKFCIFWQNVQIFSIFSHLLFIIHVFPHAGARRHP